MMRVVEAELSCLLSLKEKHNVLKKLKKPLQVVSLVVSKQCFCVWRSLISQLVLQLKSTNISAVCTAGAR